MADVPQHQLLEPISSSHHPDTNTSTLIEDNHLVNIDAEALLPYTFVVDPFSPLDSSFFVPCSSSSVHHPHRQVNSDSCSCCCLSESETDSESDCADSTVYPDCLYGHDEVYDQMDFITDLFNSREEIEHESGGLVSADVGISEFENTVIDNQDDDFVANRIDELGLGLRVARIESDSDTEDFGDVQNNDRIENSDLNTEEHERDGLSSVIEEISVSSEGDESVGVLEWEILMAVNNLERGFESGTDGTEGFVYTPEFDTLIGRFVDTVRALRGSPPAAKSFIDNLPLVVLKDEDDAVTCAVCKDEISIEERVAQLPCMHHYHGECIVPWLSIRNTCPVCRFELPTDDDDYERSKNRVDNDDAEVRVGYGFDLLP
ncbi:hypothetical protein QVD17_18669 [Tagetes erecta]|uniref:RING-type E3 ubiquitin transferase n=1 Tax=Tagetes erecta TaxID=13708 RepID=A0AAD8KKY1_TARER|nr:hypothetical protein QVD17_18669 [Tagetes erecta]